MVRATARPSSSLAEEAIDFFSPPLRLTVWFRVHFCLPPTAAAPLARVYPHPSSGESERGGPEFLRGASIWLGSPECYIGDTGLQPLTPHGRMWCNSNRGFRGSPASDLGSIAAGGATHGGAPPTDRVTETTPPLDPNRRGDQHTGDGGPRPRPPPATPVRRRRFGRDAIATTPSFYVPPDPCAGWDLEGTTPSPPKREGEGPTRKPTGSGGRNPTSCLGQGVNLPLTAPSHRAIEVRAANPYRHNGEPFHNGTDPPGVPPKRKPPWGAGPSVQSPPI
ncbi:hypothetical protein ALC57_13176 [Trachymyrmex cornetzi]|uniref:Uncharacterized protein n=1 Tax=Trachymyrmex cornetzi TaxID=471704 RepID=A0A151IZU9_9HYME|nr:hypothetical protein ALC57_13176 [Trachymyrmex cornetzi]